mmetsp:Transcript_4377/g.7322  ORF Transcript_4377/g.7322 Transcript_4377/m.7322 type:complete len:235 (-) Transcript_4377:44-748(-)
MSEDVETVIVVGGNGFVGSRMCEQAISNGYKVVSISRSGCRPQWLQSSSWAQRVEYVEGDALKPDSMRSCFARPNVRAVISCVGCFHWKQSVMRSICGETNINACELAQTCQIPRFVFVSAWRPSLVFFGGTCNPLSWITVPGYFGGKKRAEQAVDAIYGNNGVSFRAGMVGGERHVTQNLSLPLHKFASIASWFIPVIDAQDMAKAAMRFIQSDAPNVEHHICENDDIANFFV